MLRNNLPVCILIVCFCSALAASVSLAATGPVTLSGWISDAKCGARMTGYCAKACITAGEKPVFITGQKEVLSITNPETTKGFEGERVTAKGSVEDGKLTITSIVIETDKK